MGLSDEEVIHYLEIFESSRLIAVDTETTGFEVKDGRDYLMGISIATKLDIGTFISCYLPFRHVSDNLDHSHLPRLKALLESKPSIYHNLKFDLHSLNTIRITPQQTLYDTLTIAHMVNEEWPSKSLNWLSKTLLNDEKTKDAVEMWSKNFGWDEVPAALMEPYAKQDAELTFRLFEVLWPKMKQQNLDELWPFELAYLQLLTKMELLGIQVDLDFCKTKVDIGLEVMDQCRKELGFNPGSTTDLNDFLIMKLKLGVVKRTPTGNPSFDKFAMEIYDEILARDDRKEAQLVLTYRGWQKAVSSLFEAIPNLTSPDGRVRPNFKVHGTKTGRLSCEKPNLQQIPRGSVKEWNGDAKRAFTAAEGYTLVEFDYSQLEFRLATAYGRDATLLEAFKNGDDVFIPIAIDVFGSAEFRQDAKGLVYSTLYGAGIPRIMGALGLDVDNAKRVWNTFRETYPGLYEKSKLASDNVQRLGYVKYWTGRKRHLYKADSHKAFNAAVQGGAAEIVKRSMLRVDREVCGEYCRMVLTVHDSIVLEIKTECVKDVAKRVIELMTDWPAFGVKFAVDAHEWGKNESLSLV